MLSSWGRETPAGDHCIGRREEKRKSKGRRDGNRRGILGRSKERIGRSKEEGEGD
jgi:hypothetical protein